MPRYIDADNLIDKCDCLYKETNTETVDFMRIGYNHAVSDTIAIARNLPTADVVEVVRCKECVHHKNAPKTTDVWCERLDGLLPKDWFCADGERRDDAEIH